MSTTVRHTSSSASTSAASNSWVISSFDMACPGAVRQPSNKRDISEKHSGRTTTKRGLDQPVITLDDDADTASDALWLVGRIFFVILFQ